MADFRAPLRRSRSNQMVAGVVAGVAEYVGIDATLARRPADVACPAGRARARAAPETERSDLPV